MHAEPGSGFHQLDNIDYVPPTYPKTTKGRIVIFQDNDPVIKMTIKGISPSMRHVARTHRIDLDWLYERFLNDPVTVFCDGRVCWPMPARIPRES